MQIDFHHCATYVIARFSGFSHAEAATIGHAAQYVDDSTTSGFIRFANGMRYFRSATAHPMSDLDNLDNDENTISWLPFHFLPGDDGPSDNPVLTDAYVHKLVCRPDSAIARAMIRAARRVGGKPHALHRLGIAAHVFVDTFAHQGFAGLFHAINTASDLRDGANNAIHTALGPPIGHGQVGTCPDRPYLKWSYVDWEGKRVVRDNPADFLSASRRLCEEFQRYREVDVVGLSKQQAALLASAFREIGDEDGDARHAQWQQRIADDYFGFGAQQLSYEGKCGGWKHAALGAAYPEWLKACDEKLAAHILTHGENWFEKIVIASGKKVQSALERTAAAADALGRDIPIVCGMPTSFLASDYKLFHDAAKEQRNVVLADLLPAAGIYAA